jgi:hypothetical protein
MTSGSDTACLSRLVQLPWKHVAETFWIQVGVPLRRMVPEHFFVISWEQDSFHTLDTCQVHFLPLRDAWGMYTVFSAPFLFFF